MEQSERLSAIRSMPIIIMAAMALVSFSNIAGFPWVSAAIILGIIFFFVINAMERIPASESGLDIKSLGLGLKDSKIWIWLLLPIVMDAVCITLAVLFLPGYIEHESLRAGSFVPIELSLSSTLLFLVFALGEEIAWRAFFQNRLSKMLPVIPAILITSFLFTLGHFSQVDLSIVLFGLVFTFINSVLYGVIFQKTRNAWVSAAAHFAANILEAAVFVLISNGSITG